MALTEPVHILSLGAGVQSSTLALMAAHGEVTPMPIAAVFADTQAEPPSVYRWLDWLEKQLPFPVHRVTAGDLTPDVIQVRPNNKGGTYTHISIPAYTADAAGNRGIVWQRSCTRDFKLRPLIKEMRRLGCIKRGQKEVGVVQWIGISLDKLTRCKPSRDPWLQSRWPLVEQRFTRRKCIAWMDSRGYPEPPRSACIFCPFRSNEEWRALDESDFAKAVGVELTMQAAKAAAENNSQVPFLHRSCVPLDQVDLRTDAEHGQLSLWQDECEGMCGV